MRASGDGPIADCPRCGYDLGGLVASWAAACPLEGQCSECGLSVEWRDVLVERRRRVDWLVEHARGVRGFFSSAFATFFRVLRPKSFWQEVSLRHRVMPARLLLWLPALVLPLHLIAALVWWVGSLGTAWHIGDTWLTYIERPAARVLYPFVELISSWYGPFRFRSGRTWLPQVPALLGAQMAWPLVTVLLPVTRRLAKVRLSHVLRASAYSLWWVIALAATVALLEVGAAANMFHVYPGLGYSSSGAARVLSGWIGWYLAAGVFLWTAWWWRCVFTDGWRVSDAERVWRWLLIVSVLVAGSFAADPLTRLVVVGW